MMLSAGSVSPVDITRTDAAETKGSRRGRVHAHLAVYFAHQPLSWHQLQELPWHLMMSGDLGGLQTYLTQKSVIDKLLVECNAYNPDAQNDLRLYWQVLEHHGFKFGNSLLQMLAEIGFDTLTSSLRHPVRTVDSIINVEAETSVHNTIVSTGQPEAISTITFLTLGKTGDYSTIEKDEVSSFVWRLISFTLHYGQQETGMTLLKALVTFLEDNLPLSFTSHIILVQALERLGAHYLDCKNSIWIAHGFLHKALQHMLSLPDVETTLANSQVYRMVTLKGQLLCHNGRLQMQIGNLLEAKKLLTEGLQMINSSTTGSHILLQASLLYQIGLLMYQVGDWIEAASNLQLSLALTEQWHGQYHPAVSDLVLALARTTLRTSSKISDMQNCIMLYRRALVVRKHCLGDLHIQVAEVLTELGEVMSMEKSTQAKIEARNLLQHALDIQTTILGTDDPITHHTWKCLRHVDVILGHQKMGNSKLMETASHQHAHKSVSCTLPVQNKLHAGKIGFQNVDIRALSKESSLGFKSMSPKTSQTHSAFTTSCASHLSSLSKLNINKRSRHLGKAEGHSKSFAESVDKYQNTIVNFQQLCLNDKNMIQEVANPYGNLDDEAEFSYLLSDISGLENKISTTKSLPRPGTKPGFPSLVDSFSTVPSSASTARDQCAMVRSADHSRTNQNSSHASRCQIPQAQDIYSIHGQHSFIISLLDFKSTFSTRNHHRSAWYHVPGRYAVRTKKDPYCRCQRKERLHGMLKFNQQLNSHFPLPLSVVHHTHLNMYQDIKVSNAYRTAKEDKE